MIKVKQKLIKKPQQKGVVVLIKITIIVEEQIPSGMPAGSGSSQGNIPNLSLSNISLPPASVNTQLDQQYFHQMILNHPIKPHPIGQIPQIFPNNPKNQHLLHLLELIPW